MVMEELQAQYEAVPDCPVCGTVGMPVESAPNLASRCPSCKMIWHNPRFTRDTTDRYYRSGFYRRTVPNDGKYEKNRGVFVANLIDALLDGLKFSRCLDVGCGQGFLLAELKERHVCQVVGLELYPPLLTAVDDIRDRREQIDGLFDLITYIHTLEHTYDPQEELDWALGHLAQGGALVIEIPTSKEITAPHPLVFSDAAIQILMERHGLIYSNIDQRQVRRDVCDIVAMRVGEALPIIGKPVVVMKDVRYAEYCG